LYRRGGVANDDSSTGTASAVTTEGQEIDGAAEAVFERTYLWVTQAGGEHDESVLWADEIGPGLLQVLVYDHPDHVQFTKDDVVARHGLDRLFDAGISNLGRHLPETHVELDGVYALEGSDYVSSLALVMPWVVEAVTGQVDTPHGVLVAMPGRDMLVFHVVRDPDQALQALDRMMPLAVRWYGERSHPFSPWVYWWQSSPVGTLEPVMDSDFHETILDMGPSASSASLDPGERRRPGELTPDEHDRLRNLVRRSPAFIGMRIKLHDDWVEVVEPHGLEISFRPLVERVADVPPESWPDVLDEYLKGVVQSLIHGEPALNGPTDELLGRIFPRVKLADQASLGLSYPREIGPELRVLFGFDQPDQIAILTDDHVARHGFHRLYDAAIDNLYGQLPSGHFVHDDVYIIEGSDYVGSLVLVLPWVAEVITGTPDDPYGVLVAMPNHNRLIFHVLRDRAGARYALGEIAKLAADSYANDTVPLSPFVYWFRPDRGPLELVAEHAGDANGVIGEDLHLYRSDDFTAVLDELSRVRG
jgi:hypothetical protein